MVEQVRSTPQIKYWHTYGAKSSHDDLDNHTNLGFKTLTDSLSPENLAFSKSKFRFSYSGDTVNVIELNSEKPKNKLEEIKLRIDNALRRYFGNGSVKKFTEDNIGTNLKYAKNIIKQSINSKNLANNNSGADLGNLSPLELTPDRINRLLGILTTVETTFSKHFGTKGNVEDKQTLEEIRSLLTLQCLDTQPILVDHSIQQYFNDNPNNPISALTSKNINKCLTNCQTKIEELLTNGQNTLAPEELDNINLLLNALKNRFSAVDSNNSNKIQIANIKNLLNSYNMRIPIDESVQQYFSNSGKLPSNLNPKNISKCLVDCNAKINDLITNNQQPSIKEHVEKIKQTLNNVESSFGSILTNEDKTQLTNIKNLLTLYNMRIPIDESVQEYFSNNENRLLYINSNNIRQCLTYCDSKFNQQLGSNKNQQPNQTEQFFTAEQTQQFNKIFYNIRIASSQHFKTKEGIEDKKILDRIQDQLPQLSTINVVEIDESLHTCFNVNDNEVPSMINSRNIIDLLNRCLNRITVLNKGEESLSHSQIRDFRRLLNTVQDYASKLDNRDAINLLISIRTNLNSHIPHIELKTTDNLSNITPRIPVPIEKNINKNNVINYLKDCQTTLKELLTHADKLPPQEFVALHQLLILIKENFSENDAFKRSIDLAAYQNALNAVRNSLVAMYNDHIKMPKYTLEEIFNQQLELSLHQEAPQNLNKLIQHFTRLINENIIQSGNDIKNPKTLVGHLYKLSNFMTLHYRNLSTDDLKNFYEHLDLIGTHFKKDINLQSGMHSISSILFDMNRFIYQYLVEQKNLENIRSASIYDNTMELKKIEDKIDLKKEKTLKNFNRNVKTRGNIYNKMHDLETPILHFMDMVRKCNDTELLITSGITKSTNEWRA